MAHTHDLLPEQVLRNYFHAKDENRPHLLGDVFDADAVLEVLNHSDAISFPAVTQGREAISDVLVRQFGQCYENIYSFYLSRPSGVADAFSCPWLVAMTVKADGAVRVGCGRYDWTFRSQSPRLASRLVITISAMTVLPASAADAVLGWILRLPYPWITRDRVDADALDIPSVRAVLQSLPRI
jgi:hypothetical protein